MKKAFTIVEMLVFGAVVSVFFVIALLAGSAMLRSMRTDENKILATRYAEELNEWLRGEKEKDWTNFKTNASGTWCFNTSPIPSYDDSSSWHDTQRVSCGDGNYGLKGGFERRVVFSNLGSDPDNTVRADITVSWLESANTQGLFTVKIKIYKTQLNSVYTNY